MTADVEALVVTWLAARLGSVRVVAELPPRFEETLPVVQITSLPGPKTARPWSGEQPLLWSPRIDVDVYAATRAAAFDLAAEISQQLHALPGQPSEWGFASTVDEVAGPSWRPDYNSNVRRVGMTVQLTIRAA